MNQLVRNYHMPVPHYLIWKTALITIEGVDYRLVNSTNEGHSFVTVDTPEQRRTVTHLRFFELMSHHLAEVDQFFFVEGRMKPKEAFERARVVDLPEKKMARVVFYSSVLDEWLGRRLAYSHDPSLEKVTLSDASLKKILPKIKEALEPKGGQGGTSVRTVRMPSPRQFRRLLARYEECSYDAMGLVKLSGGRTPKLDLHEAQDLQIWTQFSHEYASPRQPKITVVHRDLVAHIEKLNIDRRARGLRLHEPPTYKQFLKLVHGLNIYWVKAHRKGKNAAANLYRVAYGNHEVERPGQVVEFDEWTVNLITWFSWAGALEHLSPKELRAIEKVRLKVVVAIDVATRCILAMRFCHAAATEKTVIDAIEMVVTDKSRLAALAGASSSWPYHLTPECGCADNGGSFASHQTRAVWKALDTQYIHPPAAMPWLRGSIEAVFKTFGQQFLSWFEGQTFSSIFEKGDYRSEERVTLSIDRLNLYLVQAIVDIYHFQPHSMTGEAPHDMWMRLSEKYGVFPPPPSRIRRAVFGTRTTCEIDEAGITAFGIKFQSKEVQQYRLRMKGSALVRIDRFSLHAVSMWTGVGWLSVPSTIRIPEDVSLWEWTGAAREVALEHQGSSQRHLSKMLAAVNRLRSSGAAASARAGIATVPIDEAALMRLQTGYFDNVQYIDDLEDNDPELAPLLLAKDPLLVGIPGVDDGLVRRNDVSTPVPGVTVIPAAPPSAVRGTSDIKI